MHSSRKRTGRSVTVCCSLLRGGGGFSLPGPGGGFSLPGPEGGSGGFSLPGPGGGGVLPARSWGDSPYQVPGGFSLPGPWGGSSSCQVPGGGFSLPGPRGGVLPARSRGGLPVRGGGAARRPPPVNRITHTCKNITLATTSLRPVSISCEQCEQLFHRVCIITNQKYFGGGRGTFCVLFISFGVFLSSTILRVC